MKKLTTALLALLLLASCATNTPAPPVATPTPTAPATATPTPTAAPAPTPTPAPLFTADEFPRLDGSTATIPLGEAAAALLLGISRADAAAYSAGFTGTNKSVVALADGNTDVLIVYEPPKDTLEQYGKNLEFAPIGRDALVFLVNAANPVSSLTTEQLLDIYTGKTTDWAALGGNSGEILAYQRNETSGSQTLMRRLVMGDAELVAAPAELVVTEMGGLIAAVASFDNSSRAIGYNVYYYVTEMKSDPNIKILSVDGVEATPETIGSGAYPFTNDFYAAIRKDEPADSPARRLFDWLRGRDAKELMEREGYVSIP
ncbi:MAG: substrate-binding domain-containing protein [Oscillospiraceae bacterium]|jgi:phosphate transport system substrate-binding protein|nr:substrate-binding domain-containing protein [Oscillospiraceae bacterium]